MNAHGPNKRQKVNQNKMSKQQAPKQQFSNTTPTKMHQASKTNNKTDLQIHETNTPTNKEITDLPASQLSGSQAADQQTDQTE